MANKYYAKRTSCGKHAHASKKEAKVCVDLQLAAKAGYVRDLEFQPKYALYAWSPTGAVKVCDYIADFRYNDLKELVVLDVKGIRTPVYRLKKKMMKACHGIEVQEA